MRHRLASHLTRSVLFAALILFLSSIARGQSVSFVAGRDFQASQSDTSVSLVTSGDFNNDGKVDLLTATSNGQTDDSISILLGNGDGTFQAPSTITTAPPANLYVTAIAVGDFNGDGNLDFAVLNQSTNSVVVYLGNGNGTFQAPKTTTIANPPQLTGVLVVADFNKDGKADVAVLATAPQSGTRSILVLIGKGDGTFQSPVTYAITPAPTLLATGDVNGDKNIDLITDGVSVLLGKGDGTFQAAKNTPITNSSPCGAGAGSLGIGDFTGSGVDSVAVGEQILPSNSDGTFATPVCARSLSSAGYFAVGDFNNDGKADLAGINQVSSTIFLSTGGGSVQQSQTFPREGSSASPSQYVAADLNGDGNIDLVAPAAGNNVTVYLGTGSGTFLAPSTVDTGATTVVGLGFVGILPADLNSDNTADLLLFGVDQNSGLGFVSSLINKDDGSFQTPVISDAAEMAFTGALGDFNNDTKQDVAVLGSSSNGQIAVLLGNGDGTFMPPATYNTSQQNTAIGVDDFNGDGKEDLIVAGYPAGSPAGSAGSLDLLLGNGDGTFGFATNVATIPNQPIALVVQDFNGDGNADVAVAAVNPNGTTGDIWIYLGNGNGTFQNPIDIGIVGPPVGLVAGEFAGTHWGLAAAVGNPANNVQVFLGDGTGNFSLLSTVPIGPGTTGSIVTADFNGDGFLDFAVPSDDGVSVFFNDGRANFTLDEKIDAGSPIAAADFNDDGKPDLAWLLPTSVALIFNPTSSFSFTLTGPSSATVSPGDSAKYTFQLTPTNNFNGQIEIDCSGPAVVVCKVSPSSVLLGGNSSQSVTVTVGTSPANSAIPPATPLSPSQRLHLYELATLVLICLSLLLAFSKRIGSRRFVGASTVALILLLILTCISCGGGSSHSSGGGPSGTPAGTYHLKVTASSGSITSTTNLTLIVN